MSFSRKIRARHRKRHLSLSASQPPVKTERPRNADLRVEYAECMGERAWYSVWKLNNQSFKRCVLYQDGTPTFSTTLVYLNTGILYCKVTTDTLWIPALLYT